MTWCINHLIKDLLQLHNYKANLSFLVMDCKANDETLLRGFRMGKTGFYVRVKQVIMKANLRVFLDDKCL